MTDVVSVLVNFQNVWVLTYTENATYLIMTVLRNATVTVKFYESFSLIVVSGKTMLADVTGIKNRPENYTFKS